MSAYITLATPMIDQSCLLEALEELGFGSDKVEVHANGAVLVGYGGARRPQKAQIILRRKHVGASSNDIGFERTPTGFRTHVSDYDQGRFGQSWLSRLTTSYKNHELAKQARLDEQERLRFEEERRQLVEAQRQAVHKKAKRMGYRVQETREGDKLRLVLVKRVY